MDGNTTNFTDPYNLTNASNCSYHFCVGDTLYRKIAGTAIFLIVWPFIVLDMKWFPLGRPAAALVGATLMVIFSVVPQDEVFAILGDSGNIQTLALLVGMMLLSYYYDREGLLRVFALWIFGKDKPFRTVLWKVCVLAAVLSAFITNDATCLVVTPLILNEHKKQKRSVKEYAPLLVGIATSSNIGSAATFFGNPQNAFIAAQSHGEVSLVIFFATSLPAAVLGMSISIGLLYLVYYRVVFSKPTEVDNNTAHVQGDNQEEVESDDDSQGVGEFEIINSPTTLSQSRDELAMSYDQSDHPFLTSQVSHERQRLYTSRQDLRAAQAPVYSRAPQPFLSVPPNFRPATRRTITNSSSAVRYGSVGNTDRTTWHGRNRSTVNRSAGWEDERSLREVTAQDDPTQPLNPYQLSDIVEQTENRQTVEVVETEKIQKRSWRKIVFIIWLVFISVLVVVLLAIPPPPTVATKFNLGLVPLGAGILTMLADTIVNRKYAYDAIVKIDWGVILMFMGLFVWLAGFQNTLFPGKAFNSLIQYMDLLKIQGVLLFTVFVIIGSNILSNVPLVILIVDHLFIFRCGEGNCPGQLAGVLLAWVSTIAGNFTLIGSIANLIVAEKARSCADFKLTFFEYMKFGFVSTFIVLFSGLPIVYFAGRHVNL